MHTRARGDTSVPESAPPTPRWSLSRVPALADGARTRRLLPARARAHARAHRTTRRRRPARTDRELSGSDELEALPDGLFAGLRSLVRLHLHGNRLSALAATAFQDLGSLEHL